MSRAPAKTAKAQPAMCNVTIEYVELLLPADKGLKLVELLQHAVTCRKRYEEGGQTYTAEEAVPVEFTSVKLSQIRMPRPAAPEGVQAPAAIGHSPLALTFERPKGRA